MTTTKSIVLITGANSGIGLATVRALYTSPKPYHIIATARSLSRLSSALEPILSSSSSSTIEQLELDITSDASISSAASHLTSTHPHLDALINNAGASVDPSSPLREGWAAAFELNITSQHLLTLALAPLLVSSPSGARLLFLTTGLSSLSEEHSRTTPGEHRRPPPTKGWPKPLGPEMGAGLGYRASKLGMHMVALQWSRTLEPDGVKVFILAPGFLATNLAGGVERMKAMGAEDVEVGGEFVKDVVEGARDGDAGVVVKREGGVLAW